MYKNKSLSILLLFSTEESITLSKTWDRSRASVLYHLFTIDHFLPALERIVWKTRSSFQALQEVYGVALGEACKPGQFPCFWGKYNFPSCGPQFWFPLQPGWEPSFSSDHWHNARQNRCSSFMQEAEEKSSDEVAMARGSPCPVLFTLHCECHARAPLFIFICIIGD